ncbi:hypothetical protein [Microcella alkalica]|uniref:hypothetical protein n=1 Tax=Microcella alkalica TaxID=355930 RepID=UPI00145E545D|nr:hypothetical protein [Microcella alkalica]
MTLTSLLIASEEQLAPLIAPPLVIAGVAALAFLMMGLVTFAYRDVANRHAHKRAAQGGHDAGHGADHH